MSTRTDYNVGIRLRVEADETGKLHVTADALEEIQSRARGAARETDGATRASGRLGQAIGRAGAAAATGRFSALPGIMTRTAVSTALAGGAFMSVLMPIAAATAGVAAFALAINAAKREQREMDTALQITSGYAGLTRQSMLDLAGSVSAASNMTIGQSKKLVTQLVSSGQIGAAAIGEVAKLADKYAAATGQSVDSITPKLVSMFSDPSAAASELNKQMHFLSVTEQERIKTLKESGRLEEAQLELSKKLSAHIPDHTKNLGYLENAWASVGKAASGAWDAMLAIGREKTLEQQFDIAKRELHSMANQLGVNTRVAPEVWIGELKDRLGGTVKKKQVESLSTQYFTTQTALQNRENETKQKQADAEKNRITSEQWATITGNASTAQKDTLSRELDKALSYQPHSNYAVGSKDYIDDINRQAAYKISAINEIKKKIADLDKPDKQGHGASGASAERHNYNLGLIELENAQRRTQNAWKNHNAALEAQHRQGLISDRQLIDLRAQEDVKQLEKHRASLEQKMAKTNELAKNAKTPADRQRAELDAAKIKGEIDATNQKIVEAEIAAQDKRTELSKNNQEELTAREIEATRQRGELIIAAEQEFSLKHGQELKNALADLQSNDEAVVEQAKKRIASLNQIHETMLTDANWEQLSQQYKNLLGDMEYEIEQIRAAAERDGGPFAGMQVSAATQEIKDRLLPQLNAVEAQLQAVAAASDSITLKRTAVELGREHKKVVDEIPKEYKQAFDQIDKIALDGTKAFLSGSKDEWQNYYKSIVEMGKSAFAELVYQAALRPIVVSVFQAVYPGAQNGTSGTNVSGTSNLLSGGWFGDNTIGKNFASLATNIGGKDSALSSWFGGAGSYSNLSYGVAGLGGGVAGSFIGKAIGGKGGAQAGSMGGSAGAMIGMAVGGPIGAVVGALLGSVAGGLLGADRGGPKVGGSYTGRWAGSTFTEQEWRSFTPNEEDDVAKQLVAAAYTSIIAAARRQGVKIDNLGLNIGFDSDPKGTAPNRVSTEARIGDAPVFSSYQNLGRNEDIYNTERQFAPARLTLGVLQLLDTALGDLYQSVDAINAKGAEVLGVIALADGIKVLGLSVEGITRDVWDAVTAGENYEKLGVGIAALAAFAIPIFEQAVAANNDALADARDAFDAFGQAMPATNRAYADLVRGLDLTTEAGRATAAALIQAAPAWAQYQAAVEERGRLFTGMDRASFAQSGVDAVLNASSGEAAGQAWADSFAEAFNRNMLNVVMGQVSDLMYNAIFMPLADNMMVAATNIASGGAVASTNLAAGGATASTAVATGGTVAGTAVATGGIVAAEALSVAVAQAKALIAWYAAILSDADVQDALKSVQDVLKDLGGDAWSALPQYNAVVVQSYDNVVKSAETVIDRSNELADYLESLDRSIARFSLSDGALRLREIQDDFDDAIKKLGELGGATDTNIAKLAKLADLQNQSVLSDLTDDWRQARLSQKDFTASEMLVTGGRLADSWNALADTLGVVPLFLEQVARADGRDLTEIGAQYWSVMSTAQREALATVLETRSQYVSAIRDMMSLQVQSIESLYNSLQSVRDFSQDLRRNVADVRIAAGMLDKSAWIDSEITRQRGVINTLEARNAAPEELITGYQVLRDLTLERWQVEYEGITRQIQFTKSLREYLDSLKTGERAPTSLRDQLTEAAAQFNQIASLAEGGDEDAMRRWRGAADTYLSRGRDVYASGSGYASIYDDVMARGERIAGVASIEELTLDQQRQIAERAGQTVSGLQAIQAVTQRLESRVETRLNSAIGELHTLGSIADSLGAGGAIAGAIADLPAALAYLVQTGRVPSGSGSIVGTGVTIIGRPVAGGPVTSAPAALPASIAGVPIRDVQDWAKATAISNPYEVYTRARAAGVPLSQVNAILEVPPGTVEQWVDEAGLPRFDKGADIIPFDMPAIVHKGETIFTSRDTHQLVQTIGRLVDIVMQQSTKLAELQQSVDRLTDATVSVTLDAAAIIVDGNRDSQREAEYARQSHREAASYV